MRSRIGPEYGSSGNAAISCTCAASDHWVCPNGVKPWRTIRVSTLVDVSPAAARTRSTAAAATSGEPRLAHRASADALSETVSASTISARSRLVGRTSAPASTASAIGTLIVDQATPLRSVPSSSICCPVPSRDSVRPTTPRIVDSSSSKLVLSAAVRSVRMGRVCQASAPVSSAGR